jgi:hypothetical protein
MEGNGPVERRFVVDGMLGKVAKWLRILGYDTRSEPLDEAKLADYASRGWAVLTRRRSWCGREGVICLHQNAPMDQMRELHARAPLDLDEGRLLSRCIRCNDLLECVNRQEVLGLVPDYTFETVEEFQRCPACRRVYWEGSHRGHMLDRLRRELGRSLPVVRTATARSREGAGGPEAGLRQGEDFSPKH